MAINTSSGCTVSIGTTQADMPSDTYKAIGFISNAGQFGRVYSLIKFDALSDRNTYKFKGQRDDGSMQLDVGRDPTDTGQAAIIAALDSDQDYNFKVELNDSTDVSGSHNTIFYFKAKIMSYPTIVGTPTTVVTTKLNIELKPNSILEIPAT